MECSSIIKLGWSWQRQPSYYSNVLNPLKALWKEKKLSFPSGKDCCSYQGFYIISIDLMLCVSLERQQNWHWMCFPYFCSQLEAAEAHSQIISAVNPFPAAAAASVGVHKRPKGGWRGTADLSVSSPARPDMSIALRQEWSTRSLVLSPGAPANPSAMGMVLWPACPSALLRRPLPDIRTVPGGPASPVSKMMPVVPGRSGTTADPGRAGRGGGLCCGGRRGILCRGGCTLGLDGSRALPGWGCTGGLGGNGCWGTSGRPLAWWKRRKNTKLFA